MPFFQKLNEFNAQKQREDLASRQAVETGLNKNQPSAMPSTAPSSAPTASVQQAPRVNSEPAQTTPSPSVMQQAQVNNPALQRMTWKNTGIVPMAGQGAYRDEALRDMDEADFAKHQGQMNASDLEYWTQQFKAHPESAYAYANMMFASNETPEQKRKRERREQLGEVFNNLGNLIGNAANLYYTHRGGQYIDLNTANEKHRARMERLKEKQDALDEKRRNIIINAKLGDIKTQQAERAAERKAQRDASADALKHKREMAKLAIQHAYNLGEIDAKTAAELAKSADKAKTDKELEAIRHANRMTLKATPSYGEDAVEDSAMDRDGFIWTRTSKLTDNELRQIAQSSPMYHKYEFQEMFKDKKTGRINHREMASWLMANNHIPSSVYEQMGFKKGKTSKKSGLGWGNNDKSNEETDW